MREPLQSLMLAGALSWLSGCVSLPSQPPVDLAGPDWTIRNGQAVWKPARDATEIAGELLLASHPDGSSVVQFTKPPLPFVSGRQTARRWQVQFFGQNKTYAGHGRPPARLVWLQLPLALAGHPVASGWLLTRGAEDTWHFESTRTGEHLDGFLTTTKLPSTHRIEPQETLTGVALWHGVSVESLQKANPGPPEVWFKPGQVIRLPALGAP